MNIVILTGRLTADPEYKLTRTGKEVTNFTIAVNRYENITDYFDCQAWGKTAEFIHRYFSRGKRIGVQGEINIDIKKDQTGKNQKFVRVNVYKAEFVVSKTEEKKTEEKSAPSFSGFEEIADDKGDLPFS